RGAQMRGASLRRTPRLFTIIALVACLLVSVQTSHAQTQNSGTLRVTVVDPSGAVVVGATVTVSGVETGTQTTPHAPVQTSEAGVAAILGLPRGRYVIQAEYPGFEKRVLPDVRVRSGENRQVAVLAIQRVETDVTVAQDRQQVASDRNGPTFGTTLTRDQIE